MVPFSRGKQGFSGIIVTALFRKIPVSGFVMIFFRYQFSSLAIM
jgi:hypothetical protein